MATSATGFSIYVGFGSNPFDGGQNQGQSQKTKPKSVPKQKDQDHYYNPQKTNPIYGSSPTLLTSKSANGLGAPNNSPKL